MRAILSLIVILLLATTFAADPVKKTSFGLRTVEQCNSDITIIRDSQLMACYRAAAITSAFSGNKDSAKSICSDIYTKFKGTTGPGMKNDAEAQAALLSNSCFYEIAKIFRDPVLCDKIEKHNSIETGLLGEDVTSQLCHDQVDNMAKLSTTDYYNDPSHTNICAIVFILPVLVIGAFWKN